MFNFYSMLYNYSSRNVNRYEENDVFVDTSAVNDGEKKYETAVEHREYNNGKIIIVEAYDTIEEAKVGHGKWVKVMTTEPLPDVLSDCANSMIQRLSEVFGNTTIYLRIRNPK